MWELDHKESLTQKNRYFWTVVFENTLESPLDCKEIQPVHPKGNSVLSVYWKDWFWSWSSNTLATWCQELTHWKSPWCWERLKVGGEVGGRGWDGWMVSLVQWTWVWANSGRWWWTGKPCMLQFLESQRVRHDLVTEQQYVMLRVLVWLSLYIGLSYETEMSLKTKTVLSIFRSSASSSVF